MLVICIASGTLYNESMACTIIHLSLSVRPFSDEVSSAVFVCLIASFVVTPSPAPFYLCALRHLIPFAVGGNDGKEDSEYREATESHQRFRLAFESNTRETNQQPWLCKKKNPVSCDRWPIRY